MRYQGLTLDPFQQRAIEAIDAGRSVLVAAPTGTGKTLIADYLVDQVLREGGRIIYTAPIKALSNQKFRDYTRLYGADKVGLVTGDVVVRADAPLRVMTTEILRNILLQGAGAQGEPDQIGELRAVIFDELHFLDDPERGTVWEEVLIYLPQEVRVLGLSATMPNIDELAGWLEHVRPGQGPITVIQERKRAVPLRFVLANNELGLVAPERFEAEQRRWRKEQGQQQGEHNRRRRRERRSPRQQRRDDEQTTFRDLIGLLGPRDLPALFFVFSRRVTENFARGISGPRGEGYLSRDERATVTARLERFEAEQPGVLGRTHVQMYERGVAFHHAGLHVQLKALVEELYEGRLIKILFCTSTFALGINMPARTVLFEALEKYNGKEVAPLTVRQFMQKAGRAGRRGLDAEGQVVIRMELEGWEKQREYIQRLIEGRDEPVQSSFNLSFHSVVNLMERHSEEEIKELLSRSFLAWQRARKHDAIREQIQTQQARVQMARRAAERSEELSEAHDQSARKLERDLEKLKRRLEREQLFLWNQFQDKVKFLKELGYLDKSGGFGAGARVLRVVQIEELFVGEMILAGIFEGLRAEEVYALSVGLTQELPPRVQVNLELPSALSSRLRAVDAILKGEVIERAVALAGGEPRCDARMMALGYHWAAGVGMGELLGRVRSEHDISGDIVGALRRAKDLVGQLRALYEEEDPELATNLRRVMREVSRDEVEVI